MSRKRKVVALLLAPVTVPFVVLQWAAEGWHFGPSTAVVALLRRMDRRLFAFFDSLDKEQAR